MKKVLLYIVLFGGLSCITGCFSGCKSDDNTLNKNNPYPLTNEMQHADGTQVKPPSW